MVGQIQSLDHQRMKMARKPQVRRKIWKMKMLAKDPIARCMHGMGWDAGRSLLVKPSSRSGLGIHLSLSEAVVKAEKCAIQVEWKVTSALMLASTSQFLAATKWVFAQETESSSVFRFCGAVVSCPVCSYHMKVSSRELPLELRFCTENL
ncbi:hypothetical protein SAY87_012144 [Trapa incisa]|uniref:Uncharacterized protein n=1 Tax=Trapa incisa TaxID=236973 RepID=A0AAN7GSY9_9MYRT|nr:hypothetical protein SAY87_012144 [Trapa incisa]